MKRNPIDDIDLSFDKYVQERSYRLAKHMEGGVPDYAYSLDYATRQKINAIPGVFRMFKIFTSQIVPHYRQQLNVKGTKVTPNQLPHIYKMTQECAEILGIGMPTVFIEPNPSVINAYAMATEDAEPIVVLTSAIVERTNEKELKAVIGHECGHVHNNHGIYNLVADAVLIGLSIGIPGVDQIIALASLPIQTALLAWSRAAEITCDRAGIICSGEADSTIGVHALLQSGGILGGQAINIDELLQQYETLRNSPIRYQEMFFATHPAGVRRILAAKEFMNSEVYYTWHPEQKEPDMKLVGKEELDRRTTKFVSVTKSDER